MTENSIDPAIAYGLKQAAAMVGLSVRTLYNEAAEGRLVITKIGRRSVIRRAELEAFVDSHGNPKS